MVKKKATSVIGAPAKTLASTNKAFQLLMASRDSPSGKSKVTSANGVKGCIIDSPVSGPFFRVYDEFHNFRDYEIRHSDLFITIDDEDACFHEHPDGSITLDHSPETLGISEEQYIRVDSVDLGSMSDK